MLLCLIIEQILLTDFHFDATYTNWGLQVLFIFAGGTSSNAV